MAYILLLIWMLFCYFCIYNCNKIEYNQRKKAYYFLFFVGCTLLMGLRNEYVGMDTQKYKQLFEMTGNVTIKEMIDETFFNRRIGYMLFMKIINYIGGSYYTFQIVVSILFNYLSYRFICNNSKDPFLATSIFLGCGFYLSALNVQRETFAVVLILPAWDLINRKRYFSALIISLVAVSCHTTAIIFIIAYIIYLFKDNKYALRILPVLIVVAAIKHKTIIAFASSYFSIYSNYYKNNKTLVVAGGVTIIWAIMIVLSTYCIYNKTKFNNQERIYGLFCLISVISDILGTYFNYIDRLGTYFLLFEILLVEAIANSFKEESFRRRFKVCVASSFLAYFLLSAVTSSQYQYNSFL